MMREVPAELLEPLPDGLPRVSRFDEYCRIMGVKPADKFDAFDTWARLAVTLMQPSEGNA